MKYSITAAFLLLGALVGSAAVAAAAAPIEIRLSTGQTVSISTATLDFWGLEGRKPCCGLPDGIEGAGWSRTDGNEMIHLRSYAKAADAWPLEEFVKDLKAPLVTERVEIANGWIEMKCIHYDVLIIVKVRRSLCSLPANRAEFMIEAMKTNAPPADSGMPQIRAFMRGVTVR